MTKLSNRNKGILLLICSAFFFALMNLMVQMSGDIPVTQKSFFRNLIAVIFAFLVILNNKKERSKIEIKKEIMLPLILRSTLGTLGILANFYSVSHLVLSDASLLNKMSPFFVIIFSFIILKEKVSKPQICIVVMAFVGCLFVIKPTFQNANLHATLIGLFGGLCAGISYTIVRMLGEKGASGSFLVMFFSGFSTVAMLPFLVFDYHPMSISQTIILILAGVAAAGGQFSITMAYFYAPAKEISVYDYSQIIFAAILGFAFFSQIPDIWSFIGYIVIISAAVLMYKYNNKKL